MTTKPTEPTATGMRTYAEYARPGYYEDAPCTCEETCKPNCKGECGCEACHLAYGDYLSSE